MSLDLIDDVMAISLFKQKLFARKELEKIFRLYGRQWRVNSCRVIFSIFFGQNGSSEDIRFVSVLP